MRRVRLLLTDLPPLLHDIVAVLAEGSQLEIVSWVGPRAGLLEAVRSSGADVVLMSERMDQSPGFDDVLFRHPRLRLLTLSPNGDRLRVHMLVAREATVTDVSPNDLIDAIFGQLRAEADGPKAGRRTDAIPATPPAAQTGGLTCRKESTGP